MTQSLNQFLRAYTPIQSKFWWANLGRLSSHMDRFVPIRKPVVLVISLPRSGSSWVGSVLSNAPNTMYLREPITQTNRQSLRAKDRQPVMFELGARPIPRRYTQVCKTAFSGIPAFDKNIVSKPEQFLLSHRKSKKLVIKEVNPLGIAWFIENYRPKVVYLVRHPAAVANSYHRLGWTKVPSKEWFNTVTFPSCRSPLEDWHWQPSSASFWSYSGMVQAMVSRHVSGVLAQYPDCKTLRYEDICLDPQASFRALYEFCGLTWDSTVAAKLTRSTTSSAESSTGEYTLKRNSAAMAKKWVDQIAPENLSILKQAYLHHAPTHYAAPADW